MAYIHYTTGKPRQQIGLQDVKSSQIKAMGHDPATNTLAMQFSHGIGAIYHYPDVTADQYKAFVTSDSLGKHFGMHIKALRFDKFIKAPDRTPKT